MRASTNFDVLPICSPKYLIDVVAILKRQLRSQVLVLVVGSSNISLLSKLTKSLENVLSCSNISSIEVRSDSGEEVNNKISSAKAISEVPCPLPGYQITAVCCVDFWKETPVVY